MLHREEVVLSNGSKTSLYTSEIVEKGGMHTRKEKHETQNDQLKTILQTSKKQTSENHNSMVSAVVGIV